MSIRAFLFGLMFALWIAVFTFYNDYVIKQPYFTAHLMPVVVFGGVVLLLLVVNPLIGFIRRAWMLRASELGVITALALVGCAWPATGLFYSFGPNLAKPADLQRNRSAWRAADVMSYMPGASPKVASGFVKDWVELAREIESAPEDDPLLGPIAAALPETFREVASEIATSGRRPDDRQRRELMGGLNTLVDDLSFYERVEPAARSASVEAALEEAERVAGRRRVLREELALLRRDHEAETERLAPELERIEEAFGRLREEREEAEGAEREAVDQALEALEEERAAIQAETRRLRMEITRAERLSETWTLLKNRWKRVANRRILAEALDTLLPMPEGKGGLLVHGELDTYAVTGFARGWGGASDVPFLQQWRLVPWEVWWGPLLLWGGMAFTFGLASIFMALIVHPQWSKRELLAYPMARFVREAIARDEGSGRLLPRVGYDKIFWYGLGGVVAIHLLNGLHLWNPDIFFLHVPLAFEQFTTLKTLFPTATQVSGAWAVFYPGFILTIVAFAFFLSSDVSLSLGLCGVLWLFFGSILIQSGVSIESDYIGARNSNLLLFGAWAGFAGLMFFIGRHYYTKVLASTLGLRRAKEVPGYAVWAGRGLLLCFLVGCALMMEVGIDWPLALACTVLVLLVMLLISRINAETGAFFIQPYWMPVGIIMVFMGLEATGPQNYVLLALACLILIGDSREMVMPLVLNGLRIADRPDREIDDGEIVGEKARVPSNERARPAWVGPAILAVALVSFAVAGVVTLGYQYNYGANSQAAFEKKIMPAMPFDKLATHVGRLEQEGTLPRSLAMEPLERLLSISPEMSDFGWIGMGLALVIGCAVARIRLPWWPLHPVIFLLWGTFGGYRFAWCFLAGWCIKTAVVRLAGASAYQRVKPLMVGVIAGEMLIALIWILVGILYFFIWGSSPPGTVVNLI